MLICQSRIHGLLLDVLAMPTVEHTCFSSANPKNIKVEQTPLHCMAWIPLRSTEGLLDEGSTTGIMVKEQ